VPLEHGRGVVEVAEQQGVGDEAGLVTADDRALADLLHEAGHVGEHRGLGHHRAHDLDQVLHRRGVEEVDADHPAGMGVGGGDLGDGQRRGVGGQDRVGRDDRLEIAEDRLLGLHRLDHGLDHEVGVGQVLQRGREGDPSEQLGLVGLGHLLALDRPVGGVLEVLAATLQPLVVDLDADDGIAVAGEDLGDAGTHGAESYDADRGEGAGRCRGGFLGRLSHGAHYSMPADDARTMFTDR
jgi:hypothetical protein